MPASEPDSDSSGGITTSSAGSASSDVEAALDREAREHADDAGERPARHRLAHDAAQDGRCVRQPTTRHDAAHERAQRRRAPASRRASSTQRGREEQARQRHRVGRGGDDGRGDVVEVPLVAHARARRRATVMHQHDDDRDDPADHRDDDEVGDRDRVLDTERDREALGDDREQERERPSTARPPTRGSGRRACRCATISRNVPVCTAVPSRLPSAPKTLPRMPTAAGTRIIRPGSSSRVPVMEPSVRPAMRPVPVEIRSATKPARTPEGPRGRARRSAHRRGAGSAALGDWEVRSPLSSRSGPGGSGAADTTANRTMSGSTCE